jgi:hypothetical protein
VLLLQFDDFIVHPSLGVKSSHIVRKPFLEGGKMFRHHGHMASERQRKDHRTTGRSRHFVPIIG